MKIEVIGIIDSEKEEIFKEIDDNAFEWEWTEFHTVTVEGSDYNIGSFTMWLDSIDVMWCER